MANAIIRHAVKDNAWFTANASLVLQLGRIVFKSNTLTFVRGDGVTQLSALTFYDCNPGDRYRTTSTTSNTITPTGTKTFTVDAGLSYTVNQDVIVSFDANNYMNGHVVSYSGTTLVVDIQHKTGSGTYASWVINLDGLPVTNTIQWGDIGGNLPDQDDLNTALTNLQSNINTVDSDLSSHLNNSSNPHSTTLAQVVSANDFLPADITGGNDFVLRPDSTTPGAASAVIEKGDSWMYINAGQVWIGDKVQNIGYYANIGAGDTGIYNTSGGVTVEASGSINMGGGVVTNVADAVGATDAVNKLQLDGKQNQLNGTGFVKATGTTISYDSNSYIVENTWINYTPVWTGFSVNPTVNAGDAQYLVRGKMCLVRLRPSAGGTSNATTLTVTLPFVSAVTNNPQIFNGIIQNNGTISNNPARIEVASNSNIATAYTNNQLGAFTASGTKTVLFQIEYQLP